MLDSTLIGRLPVRLQCFSDDLLKTSMVLFAVLSEFHQLFFQAVKSRVDGLLAPFTSIFFHIYTSVDIRLKLLHELVTTLQLCHQPSDLVLFQLELELHLTVIILVVMVDYRLALLLICSDSCRVDAITHPIILLIPTMVSLCFWLQIH